MRQFVADTAELRLASGEIRKKTDNNTKNIDFLTPLEVTFLLHLDQLLDKKTLRQT